MRSLTLLSESSRKLDHLPLCVTHNAVENQLYVVSLDQDILLIDQSGAELPTSKTTSFQSFVRLPLPTSVPTSNLKIWATYLSDSDALCIALSTGHLYQVFLDGSIEKIGELDSGIQALAWSYDESVVAIVNGAHHLVLLTHHFHPLTEFPVHTTDLGEQALVALGWGKKETQFHGSLGKQAAKQSTPIQQGLSASDDLLPHISWRGDDLYFVVSSIHPEHQRRILRMYSKEGILQSTSEPVSLLEHTLAWKPSGNLIASSQVQPHQHLIVFFEKNGLRHGEFVLPQVYKDAQLKHLAWNLDSTVLLVWLKTSSDSDLLQLWTCSNYHWRLQQCIVLPFIQHVQWDLLPPLRLYVVTLERCYQYHFSFQVLTSFQTQVASVGVVDTFKFKHTPFLHANIPPPFSQSELSSELPIKSVAFCQAPEKAETIALINGWDTSDILIFQPLDEQARSMTLFSRHNLLKPFNMTLRQPLFLTSDLIVFLAFLHEEEVDALVYVNLDSEKIQVSEPKILPFYAYLMAAIPPLMNASDTDSALFCIQDTTGQMWKGWISNDHGFSLEPWITLPEFPADTMSVDSQGHLISLTSKAKLYSDTILLCANCLSFTLYKETLFYTTMHHQLICYRAHQSSTRAVELGAKLVVASSTMVVLQMPRGNLETVYPRMLLFDVLQSELKLGHWLTSFELCRRHRLDSNVLVDLNPTFFMQQVKEFVTQLNQPDYLNLFLSHLKNEDTLLTKETSESSGISIQRHSMDTLFFATKVNTLCDLLRTELMHFKQDSKWMSSYLTTFVKKQPPEIEAALQCLRHLPLLEQERALQYLVFLVDVNTLMEVALGMYDLELYLLVAQASHGDPRDYLAFLEKLHSIPSLHYQKFSIDHHLKRHAKAFDHLLHLHDTHWEELVQYMKYHRFYSKAIQVLSGSKRHEVFLLYAQHLFDQGKYLEAGQCYVQANQDRLAMDMFERAGAWKEVLTIAKKLKLSFKEVQEVADTLIEYLTDEANYWAIGCIYHMYLNDIPNAVKVWMEGGMWVDAIRIIEFYGETDLLESILIPSIQKAIQSFLSSLPIFNTDVRNRVDRLLELHQEQANALKQRQLDELNDFSNLNEDNGLLDNVDVITEAGSVKTTFTGQTFMTGALSATGSIRSGKTGKSRRKQERKRHLGKKGSPYEESYLYESIRKLVSRCDDYLSEVKQLLQALFLLSTTQFDVIESAQQLQASYGKMLLELKKDLDRVAEDNARLPISKPISSFAEPSRLMNNRVDSVILHEPGRIDQELDRSVPKLSDSLNLQHVLLH